MQVSECLFLSFWNYIFEDAVSRGLPSGQDLLPCFFLSNVLEQGITPTDYHAKERRLANTYLAEALSRRGTRPWEHRGESEANLPCRAGAQVAHSSPPRPPPPWDGRGQPAGLWPGGTWAGRASLVQALSGAVCMSSWLSAWEALTPRSPFFA